MNKVLVTLLGVGCFLISSCKTETTKISDENTVEEVSAVPAVTAEEANDYIGVYSTTLPCPTDDCRVELSLELLPNKSFIYSTQRVGIDKEPLSTVGNFHFEKDGNTILLNEISNVPNAFLISEGKLFQLDEKQQRITGPNAEEYTLNKKND